MLKFITLVCALIGLFIAISLEAWLRNHTVRTESTTEVYGEMRSRYSEFWSIQYLPLIIILITAGAAIFFGIGKLDAAAFTGGAVLCFVSVIAGSRTVVTGSITTSSIALSGDVRGALRSAYRSAAIMGLTASAVSLIGLGSLFFVFKTKQLIALSASFGLGAAFTSFMICLSGSVFSAAYSLYAGNNDFTDYTGMFIGSSSDHTGSFIMSVCSAVLLAEVAVDTSGVMSTFTRTSAARYPLIVFGAGIAASVIGVLTYRGRIVRNPAAGLTAGNIVAAVLVIAASVYFSYDLMQSYLYAFCVASGIAAALISGELMKLYASDGYVFRRYIPSSKKVGVSRSMLFSLSAGLMSAFIPAVLSAASMIVSYKFANLYGVALAAAGINSMFAVNFSIRGFAINAASASEITSAADPDAESPNPADVLLTASAGSEVIGKTYSAISLFVTCIAMFSALSASTGGSSVNLINTGVFSGLLAGIVSVFIFAGLIIRSVRMTGEVLKRSADEEKQIRNLRGIWVIYLLSFVVPLSAGFAGGVGGLISFACASGITGACLIFVFNGSGKYFDSISMETLGSVIRFMIAFAMVCAPVFTGFGGIL
ncbi:MAG: sodium/proton-translocating pyrophosphatase [Mogibacterium sp.]|nr:sodium/proton-translocating pyrophosphatase [Mogibacterium sp.]